MHFRPCHTALAALHVTIGRGCRRDGVVVWFKISITKTKPLQMAQKNHWRCCHNHRVSCKLFLQLFPDSWGSLNNFIGSAKCITSLINIPKWCHISKELSYSGYTLPTCKSGNSSLSTTRSERPPHGFSVKKQVLKFKGHQASQLLQGFLESQESTGS